MAAGLTLDTEPSPGLLAGVRDAQAGSRTADGDRPGRGRTRCAPSANPRSVRPGADTAASPSLRGPEGARGGGPRCPLPTNRASSAPGRRAGAELVPWALPSAPTVACLPRLPVSGTGLVTRPLAAPFHPHLALPWGSWAQEPLGPQWARFLTPVTVPRPPLCGPCCLGAETPRGQVYLEERGPHSLGPGSGHTSEPRGLWTLDTAFQQKSASRSFRAVLVAGWPPFPPLLIEQNSLAKPKDPGPSLAGHTGCRPGRSTPTRGDQAHPAHLGTGTETLERSR